MLWMFFLSSLWPEMEVHGEIKDWKKSVNVVAISAIKLSREFNIGGKLNTSNDFKQVLLPLFSLSSYLLIC